ncbi:MAG: alcohol dehydrogenase catalytic domain-containing protein [Chloroflexi bacterium]|nr:alcohol dehydrogenase catalytic domain-containing protein [Chloroflexota bacterium]
MQAARFTAPSAVRVDEIEPPLVGPGEVLVKVLACGLCGSDLNAWRGVPGMAFPLNPGEPGHEVWGQIASAGTEVRGFVPGQYVTGMLQRGYAQFAVGNPADLAVLESDGGTAEMPLLGEPIACAANVVRRSGWQPGQPVAFVGFGYLAALIAALLFAEGPAEWIAVSRRPDSRALARARGAEAAYGFDEVPEDRWDRYPVVIEAAGVQQALDYATWLTAYSGRLVLAGYHADGSRTVNVQSWNWKGLDVVNAHERRPEAYRAGLADGLRIVRRHHLDLRGLASHTFRLSDIATAFQVAAERPTGFIKGVVLPWP